MYQVLIFLSYLLLLYFLLFFSLNYNQSQLFLFLSFHLLYVSTYSTNINYQVYFYCTRQFQFHYIQ